MELGKDVSVGPYSIIGPEVKIGDGTIVKSHVVIAGPTVIGRNCKFFQFGSIGEIPQDLKFAGEKTQTVIGDNTVIREAVTISRGTTDKFKTVIGKNCLLMAYVHVAHDCIVGNNCILVNTVQVAGHVTIDDWAIIGGASALHQFVKVGAHVMLSGGSLVRKDVPPFTKAAREPLTYAGINTVGLRRRGFASEKISEIQEIYRYIFLKGLNNSKALDIVEKEVPASPEKDYITSFIRTSQRGVILRRANRKAEEVLADE